MENIFYEIDFYSRWTDGNLIQSFEAFINPANFQVIRIMNDKTIMGPVKKVIFFNNLDDDNHFQTTLEELNYLESIGAITLVRKPDKKRKK